MSNIGTEELGHINSPFHQELIGNADVLIEQLEEMVRIFENPEEEATEQQIRRGLLWDESTDSFNKVLGGLQTFLTGLHIEFSRLEFEAKDLESQRTALEINRDELIEKSHNLHCRIQYNALDVKLDQTFSNIEKCTSVESAQCFKDESEENLRRTKELIRTANLRNCQLDKDIFSKMEHVTNLFKTYESERETYVKELDLFDDVRRRKISNFLNDERNEEEYELAENVLEFIDLTSRRRHLEPKLISNALRMHSFNESLAFDRQDNNKRMEEMILLQAKVDAMSGVNHVLPRTATAETNLLYKGETDDSSGQPPNDDDPYRDFLEAQNEHVTHGHALHRCPRKINLATDPITDPELLQQLEAALCWESYDGILTSVGQEHSETTATISTGFQDQTSNTGVGLSSADSFHEDVGSVVSLLCGDVFAPEKACDVAPTVSHPIISPVIKMPPSSHLVLHQIESVTVLQGSTDEQELITGLVKRKSSGCASSMTDIDDIGETRTPRVDCDERETQSQGWGLVGKAGNSGTAGTNSGHRRNSRDHM